jgi:hypothetical protein
VHRKREREIRPHPSLKCMAFQTSTSVATWGAMAFSLFSERKKIYFFSGGPENPEYDVQGQPGPSGLKWANILAHEAGLET